VYGSQSNFGDRPIVEADLRLGSGVYAASKIYNPDARRSPPNVASRVAATRTLRWSSCACTPKLPLTSVPV
jgi:hypothetical protein